MAAPQTPAPQTRAEHGALRAQLPGGVTLNFTESSRASSQLTPGSSSQVPDIYVLNKPAHLAFVTGVFCRFVCGVFFARSAGVKCCLHISRLVMASLSHLSEDLRGFRLNISRCSAGTESPFPSCVCGGSGLLFHTAGPRGIGATRPH